jgi:hypothetical protein
VLPGQWHRQSHIGDKWQKAPLQLRVGHAKRQLAEQVSKPANAGLPWKIIEGIGQGLRIDQVESVCLIDRPLETSVVEASGKIDQGEGRNGYRDALMAHDVARPQLWPSANPNAWPFP